MRSRQLLISSLAVAASLIGAAVEARQPDIPLRLSLADAIRLAVERSPSLAASRAAAEATATDIAAAARWPNPVARVASEGFNGDPPGVGFLDRQEWTVEVAQEFDLSGKRGRRKASASAAVAAARFGVDDEVRRLEVEVRRAYFLLTLSRLDGDLARASLEEIDRVIAVNRSRYQQGEVSGTELRRLEVERLRFSEDAFQAELATRNGRSALLALMGSPRLDLAIEPTDVLGLPPGGLEPGRAGVSGRFDVTALVARALESRPDVAAARQDRLRAAADAQWQRALRTPDVTVSAGLKRDFGANGLAWAVSIPLPLLDRNAPGITRADADRRAADSRLQAIELAVSLQVQEAVNAADVNRQRVVTVERDYLTKAREARDGALAAYRSGESALLEFLDAQRAYRDVQRAYNRALLDYRLSLVQLDAAVGVVPGELP